MLRQDAGADLRRQRCPWPRRSFWRWHEEDDGQCRPASALTQTSAFPTRVTPPPSTTPASCPTIPAVKFLCLDCDEAMRLHATEGPDEGSLTVTFRCPTCGVRVAMLTNPLETQLVRSLGVRIGGRTTPPEPFEHLRSALATSRSDAFESGGAGEEAGSRPPGSGEGTPGGAPRGERGVAGPTGEGRSGSGCPFAAMLASGEMSAAAAGPAWAPEAEARIARIPEFIRPMVRRAIERYAEARGFPTITEAVMDEARAALGM